MNYKKSISGCAFVLTGFGSVFAQESPTSSGGNATGSGGSVSYTVGQVAYVTDAGSNGSISQGVQQAYEIFTVGVEDQKMEISLSVYPNPTTDVLNLKVENTEGLTYQLYDMQGKLIQSEMILNTLTAINTNSLPAATYMVKVISVDTLVKTFKVVKK